MSWAICMPLGVYPIIAPSASVCMAGKVASLLKLMNLTGEELQGCISVKQV